MKRKTTNTFITVLAVVSIIGFLAIFTNTILEIDIGKYTTPILMIILGFGLMVEGQVRFWARMFKDELTPTEFSHLITGIIGIIAIIIGILGFWIQTDIFGAMQGILSVLAIIVIAIETWLVK